MKIGIITFQNALNAGAILQAYALQTILTNWGHQVEFINYCPKKTYTLRDYIAKSPYVMFHKWLNIFNGRKYMAQGNFNKVLTLSSRNYLSYEDLAKYPMDYDIYIAGSDQIWNFNASLSPVYMLEFVPKSKKKIAYAASMGQCRINESLHSAFKSKLMTFDAISIREKNGIDFINTLLQGEKQAIQTLDPTLLIDINYYNSIIEKKETKSYPYICTYILANLDKENSDIISYIKKLLNIEIINLRNPDTCIWLRHTKNKIVTPYQWLYYLKESSFIICSSFHAVVFSLIFHKPFIALVPPNSKNKGGNMRINSLLKDLNLMYRIVPHLNKQQIYQIIHTPINWDQVDSKIKQLRETSIKFLKNNLN